MIRNLIFDWSGTLVDDLPAVWEASNHVFRKAGVPELTLAQFRAEFCLPFKKFYDRFLPHVPLGQLEVWFHECFRHLEESVTELPHARDFLLFCRHRGVHTFLLSTIRPDYYAAQAARIGFAPYLEHPYTGVWDKQAKIREILAEHKLLPDETLSVGDMQYDIETAKSSGVYSCAVLTGYTNLPELQASEPDLIVAHLGELRPLLERNGMQITKLDNP